MPKKREKEDKGSLFDRWRRSKSDSDTKDSANKDATAGNDDPAPQENQADAREILARRILHSQKYGLPISDRMAKDYQKSNQQEPQPDKSSPSSPKRPGKK